MPAGKEAYTAAARVGSPGTRTVSPGGEGKRGVPASLASLRRLHLCVNTSDVPRVLSSFPLLLSVLPWLMFMVFQTPLLPLSPVFSAVLPVCPPNDANPSAPPADEVFSVPPWFSCVPMAPHLPVHCASAAASAGGRLHERRRCILPAAMCRTAMLGTGRDRGQLR